MELRPSGPCPSPPPGHQAGGGAYQRAAKGDRRVSLSSPAQFSSRTPTGEPPTPAAAAEAESASVDSGGREPPQRRGSEGMSAVTGHQHEAAAALCTAAAEGDDLTLAALLELGHPVNSGDYDRRTALHLAAEEGHLACVEVLVRHGADVNCRDRWGTTPLKGAIQHLHNDVANFLRDHGAKYQDDQADQSQYAVHKKQCRVWFDHALQFCGLAPESHFLPVVGLAGYLYVEHGINAVKHKAIAQELGPLRKALRSLSAGDAETDLKKWISVGENWTRNVMPPAPPQLRTKRSGVQDAGDMSFSRQGRSPNTPLGQQDMPSSSWTPNVTPVADGSCLRREFPMLNLEGGVPPDVASALYSMYGRSICTYSDFVLAVLGQKPEGGSSGQGKPARPPTARALQTVVLGRLQIPNWRSFVESILELAARVLDGPNDGRNADYIPELSEEKINPAIFGVAVCTVDGQQLAVGDTGCFTIQSCGKPFVYAQSVEEYGADHVHKYVGQEPSGRAFNDFALTPKGQPFNAVTNAGAMMTASLYHPEETLQDRTVRYIGRVRRFCGGEKVDVDEAVFKSEQGTAYRNHAIANFMMSEGCYPEQVSTMSELQRHVDFYLRTCAVRVNCLSLANMAATLANYGTCPLTADKILAFNTVKLSLQLAYSCGMYNFSGEWACTVGIPAKSGVSGAIWLAVPGVLGLCVRSPRLDSIGNSVRGVRFSRQFAERFQWGVMDLLYRASDREGQAV
eukprot:TRINITY_DN3215_c0_g3_i2.p1 TRINITY_DN3215_c0_g3~~TRINITY_DN3215_c0_g3_i2.p1  ORF type:complete len:764 (+),score=211.75 TRINITY_DN3215_c0_g3_i2:77-2293(+)